MTAFQTFTAGQVLTAAQQTALQANSTKIAIFTDEKSNGTDGGTSTNTYTTRTLNTTRVNNITGCSLGSSIVTLTAGSYYIECSAPANNANGHKVRLFNNTTSGSIAIGSAAYSPGGGFNTESKAYAYLTITGSTNIIIQHIVNNVIATTGFGRATSMGSDNEVYAQIMIQQIA